MMSIGFPLFNICCYGLTWQAVKHHAAFHSLPPDWDGGENWKIGKILGMDRLIGQKMKGRY